MIKYWPPYLVGSVKYDLSHLNGENFTIARVKTEDHPEKIIKVYLTFGYHCFTEHYGDDSHIYEHPESGDATRYFCLRRYGLSKPLKEYVISCLRENPYLGQTFVEKHERYFYIDANYQLETYRIFLKIYKSNHHLSDIKIDVVSAYPEDEYSEPVKATNRLRFFRIVDAKLEDISLDKKRRR